MLFPVLTIEVGRLISWANGPRQAAQQRNKEGSDVTQRDRTGVATKNKWQRLQLLVGSCLLSLMATAVLLVAMNRPAAAALSVGEATAESQSQSQQPAFPPIFSITDLYGQESGPPPLPAPGAQ
jgi:hypothetical protein